MLRYMRPPSLRTRFFARPPPPLFRHARAHSVQRVHFVNPVFTTRRMKTFIAFTAAFFVFFEILDLAIDDEEVETDQSAGNPSNTLTDTTERSKKDNNGISIGKEDEEEPIFIPLGWPKQLPKQYYKGSDPEWQSFLAFNRDPKKAVSLQRELVRLVGAHAMKTDRGLRKALGQPVQVHRVWLEIDYPDAPPREYERSGLEIGDDYIALTKKPVSTRNVSLLKNSLYPKSMFSSFWASWSTLGSLQIAKIRRFFNLESEMETKSSFSTIAPSGRRISGTVDSRSTPGATPNQAELPTDPNPLKQDASKSASPTSGSNDPKFGRLPSGPPLPTPGEEMKEMAGAFKRTLAKTWKPSVDLAPRGTFFMSGLFEIRSKKATCILEVIATYHPVERRFVTMGWKVRRLKLAKQTPRGGP